MQEKIISNKKNGMAMMLLLILASAAGIGLLILGISMDSGFGIVVGIGGILLSLCALIALGGLKVLKPQEALVLTLFGNYLGTLKGEGFYWVNPFATAVNPAANTVLNQSGDVKTGTAQALSMKMSLKIMTLSNNKQKINDCLGNPVEIGIAVMWRVVDTAKAAFNVDNYKAFLSLQCDSALRNIVRLYPYDSAPDVDTTGDGIADDGSLRGSSEVVAARIKEEIQSRVTEAGIEIVDGAVGMGEMALERLNERGTVQLDEERKAVMVSNLLVVLCGNKDAQPIVNSGSLY